jgi:hypothetical protein
MEIVDFRFLTTDDEADSKWIAWSRVYEYTYVINKLKELNIAQDALIHNTAWGFAGCHVLFKEELDRLYPNCLHSDIREPELDKTIIYDITKPIEDKYKNYFDVVINISVIEEVNENNVSIIMNLLEQVKIGGYLILTFDYNKDMNIQGNGSISLDTVSTFVGKNIENDNSTNNINGVNSICPEPRWAHLQCGVLAIKKV